MNIGGGEAADQLVRMMLTGTEAAVRLSGSALKNVLAISLALKTISGFPARSTWERCCGRRGICASSPCPRNSIISFKS